MASKALSGLTGLAGINAIQQDDAFATPEDRMGGPANTYHSHAGEQAIPYSWQSQAVPGARSGPRGLENQLYADEFWFMEPAGHPEQDPDFDYNSPSLTRSHGSVKNVGLSGPLPSQFDAINKQTVQMNNKASDLNTSNSMINNSFGYAQQDHWNEIWEVNSGSDDIPVTTKQIAFQANGFGVNDATSNAYHKVNLYGLNSKHMHRRYAMSPIPGNYMWMTPKGRPLFKTMAGPARPPIGEGSQFSGQDIGFAFTYDTGAILQAVPSEYVPPPSPNVQTITPQYDNPMGTDAIELW